MCEDEAEEDSDLLFMCKCRRFRYCSSECREEHKEAHEKDCVPADTVGHKGVQRLLESVAGTSSLSSSKAEQLPANPDGTKSARQKIVAELSRSAALYREAALEKARSDQEMIMAGYVPVEEDDCDAQMELAMQMSMETYNAETSSSEGSAVRQSIESEYGHVRSSEKQDSHTERPGALHEVDEADVDTADKEVSSATELQPSSGSPLSAQKQKQMILGNDDLEDDLKTALLLSLGYKTEPLIQAPPAAQGKLEVHDYRVSENGGRTIEYLVTLPESPRRVWQLARDLEGLEWACLIQQF